MASPSKSRPAAERSCSSGGRCCAMSLVLVIAAQQKADQESDTHRDQQRLARVGTDIGANLVGDGAEVDVLHSLANRVVAVADLARRRLILFIGVIARPAEPARCVI